MTRNGDDSHDSGGDGRRRMPVARECTYTDFLKCQPLNFKGTEGVVGLTQWIEKMESELALMYGRMFPEESDEVEKYVGGLSEMIHGSVMASKPKTMQDAIEFETELMDQKIRTIAERQAENKRKSDCAELKNRNHGNQAGGTEARGMAYALGGGENDQDLDDMEDDINA
ncbi:hypothetical protein Tco_1386200 [Tanacetum coccineum]